MTQHIHRSGKVLLALFLVALPAAVGCSRNPVTGKRELILISRDEEIAMGEEAGPEFEKEFGGKVPDAQLQAYVQRVGQSVAKVSDREMPYEYTLVSSDVPNAFALPGGKVFITAGLMASMTNERQLAAVLGHETGHVAARHNVKGLQRQMGAAVVAEIAGAIAGGDKGKTAETVAKVVAGVATLKYSRDDEYQADELGIKYMTKAGYNPWGMVELLTVLKEMSESDMSRFEEMFSTHPDTANRIGRGEQIIQGSDDYRRFSRTAADSGTARFLQMRSLLLKTLAKYPPKKK